MQAHYDRHGIDGVVTALSKRMDDGLNLSGLRGFILSQNGGSPLALETRIHPAEQKMLEFANEQLKKDGIDFIYYQPLLDAGAENPELPFKADETAFRRWRGARTAIIPLLGFVASLVGDNVLKTLSQNGVAQKKAIESLARAAAGLGLELQFAYFSNWWFKHFWSKDQPIVPVSKRLQDAQAHASTFERGLQSVSQPLVSALRSIKLSHVYNYAVNFLYSGVLYGVTGLAALAAGDESFHFNVREIIGESFVLTNAFFLSWGLYQITLGTFFNRGSLSVLRRYQLETYGSIWNNFWRYMTLVPALPTVALPLIDKPLPFGIVMQLSWGVLATLPLILKLRGARASGDALKYKLALQEFRNSASALPEPAAPSWCSRALTKLYGVLPTGIKKR